MLKAVDHFMGIVPWTENRKVVVFRRELGKKQFVKLRTFNRHKTKGCWYPSRRGFIVLMDSAIELARAIVSAAQGVRYNEPPAWWADFEKQYAGLSGGDGNVQEA